MCNRSVLVYQVTCRRTGKLYIGSTQQKLKARMEQHFDDVRLWFRKGVRTDTFARHFSRFFSTKPTAGQIRSLCDFKILESVNVFSFMKNVRSYSCRLCMAEKCWIVKSKQKYSLINSDTEIYGPCRHKSKFHRFLATCDCTDEHGECEKGKCPIAMLRHREARKKAKKAERDKAKKTSEKGRKRNSRVPLRTLTFDDNVQICRYIR